MQVPHWWTTSASNQIAHGSNEKGLVRYEWSCNLSQLSVQGVGSPCFQVVIQKFDIGTGAWLDQLDIDIDAHAAFERGNNNINGVAGGFANYGFAGMALEVGDIASAYIFMDTV